MNLFGADSGLCRCLSAINDARVEITPVRALAFGVIAVLFLILGYSKTLTAFPITDELSHLVIVSGSEGWRGTLHPWSNGFFRPIPLLAIWCVKSIFGIAPLAFHAISLLSVAILAVLGAAWVHTMLAMSMAEGVCVALLISTSPALVEVATSPAALFDLSAAIFIMSAVLCWCRNPSISIISPASNRGAVWPTVAVFSYFAMALLCKESAVVLPALLLVCHRQCSLTLLAKSIAILCAGLLAVGFAVFIVVGQRTSSTSYQSSGLLVRSFSSYGRSLIDHLAAVYFPGAYFNPAPVEMPHDSAPPSLLVLRGMFVAVILVTGAAFTLTRLTSRHRASSVGGLLCIGSVMTIVSLLPAGLWAGPVQSRYLCLPTVYAAACLFAVSQVIARRMSESPAKARAISCAILAAIIVAQMVQLDRSSFVKSHCAHALEIRNFTKSLAAHQRDWLGLGENIHVAIHQHPLTVPCRRRFDESSGGYAECCAAQWPYAQHLSTLFLHPPTPVIDFQVTSSTAMSYVWDGVALKRHSN